MSTFNDYNNQLVPHYGPNYNPYSGYYQHPPQQQQGQHPTASHQYSHSIPSVITTDNVQPTVVSPVNDDNGKNDDDDDIPDDIVASQARAWKDAQTRDYSTTMTTYQQSQQLKVPKSRNATGSDSVHPNKDIMKSERQLTTAAAAASGAVLGAIVTGPAFPVGMIVGGVISGYTANKVHKQGERRAQRKWEQSNFQHGVLNAPIFRNKQETHTIV